MDGIDEIGSNGISHSTVDTTNLVSVFYSRFSGENQWNEIDVHENGAAVWFWCWCGGGGGGGSQNELKSHVRQNAEWKSRIRHSFHYFSGRY